MITELILIRKVRKFTSERRFCDGSPELRRRKARVRRAVLRVLRVLRVFAELRREEEDEVNRNGEK